MMNDYLTVKEFAAAAQVSHQYIYKITGTQLKPFVKKINKKTMIHRDGLTTFFEPATTVESVAQRVATSGVNSLQPVVEKVAQPNSTNFSTETGEIAALQKLIAELQQDKADLKKDKEYLQQEIQKQSELIDTLNRRIDADGKRMDSLQVLLDQQQKLTLVDKAAAADITDAGEAAEPANKQQSFFGKIKNAFKS